jgi:hypothetical protein
MFEKGTRAGMGRAEKGICPAEGMVVAFILSQIMRMFCDKTVHAVCVQSLDNKIVSRVYALQRGWAFSKNNFLDLGSDDAIRKALSRHWGRATKKRPVSATGL